MIEIHFHRRKRIRRQSQNMMQRDLNVPMITLTLKHFYAKIKLV